MAAEHGLKDELVPLPSCCIYTKSSAASKTGRVVRRFSGQGGCLWYSCSWLGCVNVAKMFRKVIHAVLDTQDEGEEQFDSPAVFNHDIAVSC